MEYWEQDMKRQGYGMLLTSTQVDETAQHFYRKLGYKDCGGFVIVFLPMHSRGTVSDQGNLDRIGP